MSTDYRIKGARLSTRRFASVAAELGLTLRAAREEPQTLGVTDGESFIEVHYGSNDKYVVGFTRWGQNSPDMLQGIADAIGGRLISEHDEGFYR